MGDAKHYVVEVEVICAAKVLTGYYPVLPDGFVGVKFIAVFDKFALDAKQHVVHVVVTAVDTVVGAGEIVLHAHYDVAAPGIGHEWSPGILGIGARDVGRR